MSLYLGKSKIGNVGCGPLKIDGGTDTSDATVTASDLVEGVVAYGKDGKVTGTMVNKKSAFVNLINPSLQVSGDRLNVEG